MFLMIRFFSTTLSAFALFNVNGTSTVGDICSVVTVRLRLSLPSLLPSKVTYPLLKPIIKGPFPTDGLAVTIRVTSLSGAGFTKTLLSADKSALNVKLCSLNVSASRMKLTVPLTAASFSVETASFKFSNPCGLEP